MVGGGGIVHMPGVNRRTVVAGAAAALLARPVFGAGAAFPVLSVVAMRGDLALLQRGYERLHPGLYRYATAREIAARFDAARAGIVAPLPLGDFYLRLSRLLAGVRCGHSYANFTNQSDPVRVALFDQPNRLPIEFVWLGDRMILTADPWGSGIVPGSEIVAIDGTPSGTILRELMAVARADGHNDAKRRRLLSVQGGEAYESFDVFFPLVHGSRARYGLSVLAPDGRHRSAELSAISLAQRRARTRAPDKHGEAAVWTMERRGTAAVLTMDSWALYDSKWNWRGWLHDAVDRLIADRTPLLVVDLRRNEGGDDCGDELLARLTEGPVAPEPARRLVRYETLPADLRPYCDTWDRSFDRLGVGAVRIDDRFLRLEDTDRAARPTAPKRPRYAGRVAVLIGPQNSSATFKFAQTAHRLGLATLVGEPTGGNRRGINGGRFYFFRLPETGLEADLPLIGYFPAMSEPDEGLTPDIPAPLTAAAIASGADLATTRALALA